ncbi:MAG: Single-stranded DNA-binding protein [candidate division TM6 bacterium GW2011_GWF2_32_72]|nr:MAG: Single-stranded DNA-binding protein [candidate division TM6 bacterium GW2011_GWF2_32_72]
MAGYNRVIMVGNLTRDPENKQLSSGQSVCRLGLASNREYKNRQSGDLIQEVCFIDVDVWGPQAESCSKYLTKGRPVLVEGRLKFDSWEDKDGQKRNKIFIVADRVVFLNSGASDEQSDYSSSSRSASTSTVSASQEKNLFDQVDSLVRKKSVKPKVSAENAEMSFNDEPPFQDDLPF